MVNQAKIHRFDLEKLASGWIAGALRDLGYDPKLPGDMLRKIINSDDIYFTHIPSGFYCYKILYRCNQHGREKDERQDFVTHLVCTFCKYVIIASLLKKDVLNDRKDADSFSQEGLAGPSKWIGQSPRIFTGTSTFGRSDGKGKSPPRVP